ncbi:U2 small nuclear ribonucleoprotein B'' [Vanrija pseudolonga]|uniref:U2 small nuclear ribonucleoprotein B n=1 Tax=Vanrija pseudolonga TaxID=143232 RepID=A0AAF0YAG5_9TREE|nr:U2 small nuclear ribonucleoprotein B'' [Vanrija pseudolonga]
MAFAAPSPTLFVGNLEGKTKKPELRSQLYALFTPYGRVIDIVAKKNDGGRGQAFVVFEEQAAATAALRGLTNEKFYLRDLRISYARNPSNATLARTNPALSKEAAAVAAAKLVVSHAQSEYEQLEKERDAAASGGKRELEAGDDQPAAKRARHDEDEDEMEIEMEDDDDVAGGGVSVVCTNLPAECSEDIMGALFSQYPGFTRATALPASFATPASHPKPNAGARSFRATFASRAQAEAAVAPLSGYVMQPGWEMAISIE